jgi:hypothetical protein
MRANIYFFCFLNYSLVYSSKSYRMFSAVAKFREGLMNYRKYVEFKGTVSRRGRFLKGIWIFSSTSCM